MSARIRHRYEFNKVVAYLDAAPNGRAYLSEGCLNDVIPANNPKERLQWSDRLALLGKAHGLSFKRELRKTVTMGDVEHKFYHYLVTKT